mmetsp:Transcript_28287/g.70989  ORF Transcript_28287/g.70989 Transcript_28287/m.70989 type:complete len:261 (-) Transcript_28287:64-846(-)
MSLEWETAGKFIQLTTASTTTSTTSTATATSSSATVVLANAKRQIQRRSTLCSVLIGHTPTKALGTLYTLLLLTGRDAEPLGTRLLLLVRYQCLDHPKAFGARELLLVALELFHRWWDTKAGGTLLLLGFEFRRIRTCHSETFRTFRFALRIKFSLSRFAFALCGGRSEHIGEHGTCWICGSGWLLHSCIHIHVDVEIIDVHVQVYIDVHIDVYIYIQIDLSRMKQSEESINEFCFLGTTLGFASQLGDLRTQLCYGLFR